MIRYICKACGEASTFWPEYRTDHPDILALGLPGQLRACGHCCHLHLVLSGNTARELTREEADRIAQDKVFKPLMENQEDQARRRGMWG